MRRTAGNLRVLMVSQRLPPDHHSGAPRQALELSLALRSLHVDVSILTSRFRSGQPTGPLELDGIAIHRLPSIPRAHLLTPSRAVLAAQYIASHAKSFDVIHGHALSSTCLGALAGARSKRIPILLKPSLAGERGDLAKIRRSPAQRVLLRAIRSADRLLALSDPIARELTDAGVAEERIRRVRNGVDLARFRPARDDREKAELRLELGLPDGPIAGFIGQLIERKGVPELLDSWRIARVQMPDAHLAIAGEGPLLPAVERAAEEIGSRIILLGARDDVDRLLRAIDLLVLPSRAEGLANAPLEAFASGIGAVLSAQAAPPGIQIETATATIVDPGDRIGIATAIVHMLAAAASGAAQSRQRRQIVEGFDILEVAAEHLRIYEEVLRPASRARTPRPA